MTVRDGGPGQLPSGAEPLHAGRVLLESARMLGGNLLAALRLGCLALGVSFAVDILSRAVFAEGSPWAVLLALIPLPFWLMVCVAWHRLLLEGPERVQAPPLRLERTHGRYLLKLVLFFVAFALLTVLAVLPMGAVDLNLGAAAGASGIAVWLVLTLLTPLLLKLPGEAVGRDLPKGAWQGRLMNIAQAALVWLPFLVLAAVLTFWRGSSVDGQALDLFAVVRLAVEVLLDYLLLLVFLTLLSVIYRYLGETSGKSESG